jgi:hypothetical protein
VNVVYIVCCLRIRVHTKSLSCSTPISCIMCLIPSGSDGLVTNIIIMKRCKLINHDSLCTRAPSKAFLPITHVYFVFFLYMFCSCIAVPNSLYHYMQIACGVTFFYNLLWLMQLAIARIQNAKVTREVKGSCFI